MVRIAQRVRSKRWQASQGRRGRRQARGPQRPAELGPGQAQVVGQLRRRRRVLGQELRLAVHQGVQLEDVLGPGVERVVKVAGMVLRAVQADGRAEREVGSG